MKLFATVVKDTHFALVAVNENGIVGWVHHHTQRCRHIARRNRDKRILVRFDADLKVLHAIFRNKSHVLVGVRLRYEGT